MFAILIKTFSNKYVIITEGVEGCFESRNSALISKPRAVQSAGVSLYIIVYYDMTIILLLKNCRM